MVRRRIVTSSIAISAALCLLSVFGCSLPQTHAKLLSSDNPVKVVTYPAALRGAYIIEPGKASRYCAEPAPDVAIDAIQRMTAQLSADVQGKVKADANVTAELTQNVVQLAGRTELIMLAREMLYRACELSVNTPTSAQEMKEMYLRVAQLVQNLGEAERIRAEAELTKATYEPDEAGDCIRTWLKADPANGTNLSNWLSQKRGSLNRAMFIYGKEYKKDRAAFVEEQSLKCEK